MKFQDLNLHPSILKALTSCGYENPTPIQEKAISKALTGADILASAHTGTGKTAAFLLPALHLLSLKKDKRSAEKKNDKKPNKKDRYKNQQKPSGPRVLIVVPTRELAMQIFTQAQKYSKYLDDIRSVCVFGGVPYPEQRKKLSKKYDILIATPGRLIDHLERGRITLNEVEMLVLDEADRMLDMGFIDPVKQIAKQTPKSRQTMLFSATLKNSIINLTKDILKDPITIKTNAQNVNLKNINHFLYNADDLNHKMKLLNHILKDETLDKAIIFTSTKAFTAKLSETLREQGYKNAALHGDMPQRKRTKTITSFSTGNIDLLIATDVAARGIDVKNVSHVINFDIPQSAEDYIHRIGRTGRAGENGLAHSFSLSRDTKIIKDIEELLSKKLTPSVIKGLEPKFKRSSNGGDKKKYRKRSFKKHFQSRRFSKSFKTKKR